MVAHLSLAMCWWRTLVKVRRLSLTLSHALTFFNYWVNWINFISLILFFSPSTRLLQINPMHQNCASPTWFQCTRVNLLGCTIDFCSFLAAVLSNFADHRRPLQNSAACDCDESYTTFAVSVACRRWRISKKIFLKKLEYSATSENVDSSYENKYGLVQIKSLLSGFVYKPPFEFYAYWSCFDTVSL